MFSRSRGTTGGDSSIFDLVWANYLHIVGTQTMYLLYLYFLTLFPLSCDANAGLRGIQDASGRSIHRKLEHTGHGAPETKEYIVILNQQDKQSEVI